MAPVTVPVLSPVPVPNGALPAEDAAGEVVASIAQAQTISPGPQQPFVHSSVLPY